MPKPLPLGDTKKLKKGEQTLICRGIKYAGRTTLELEDNSTAPIHTHVLRFKNLSDGDLGALNINAKDYSKLLKEMRKSWPDFKEEELVTLVSTDIENKVEKPKDPKGKAK